MLFSSKITNSILTYLERNGAALDALLEETDVPIEFLRDPSYWLKTDEVEKILSVSERLYGETYGQGDLILQTGHACWELRSWGVLDSVLKMMDSASEIYFQPDRFLSYFISPPPPIGSLRKTADSVSFQLPIAKEEFPRTTSFLSAALEGLPRYFSREPAHVQWLEAQLTVSWQDEQESLFRGEDPGRNMNPIFLQEIVRSMEQSQRDLEEKNRELLLKNQELKDAKEALERHLQEKIYSEKLSGLSELALAVAHEINSPISYVMSNVRRLQDYLVRAQQLITLLVGQGRMDPQVQRAMQKVDWEYVKAEYPVAVADSVQGLHRIQEIVKDLSFLADTGSQKLHEKSPVNLNAVVRSAVKTVKAVAPTGVRMDEHLLFDKDLPLDPVRMEQALVNFLNNAVQSIDGEGSVRVVTRPKGNRAEIEISDTGCGMDSKTLKNLFTPFFTTKQPGKGTGLGLSIAHSIVKMHEGNITVNSEVGRGSTFLIDLPN